MVQVEGNILAGVKNRGKKRVRGRAETSELGLLRKIERIAGGRNHKSFGIQLGIGDDAALWMLRKGYETVLTTDWFLEGRHFLRNVHPPDAVGWKCLARAISDVAAMGGEPRCCLVSLAIPLDCTKNWLDGFMRGLTRCSRALACPIAGGDTTRFREILINVCVVGEVKKRTAARRSDARAGDRIFVSGRLGEAELGLAVLKKGNTASDATSSLLQKHLYPEPRIALGRWLASNRMVTAMMDLSDGLSSDLTRLCAASGMGARIFAHKLPIAGGIFLHRFASKKRVNAALHGGDDYELLFCVSRSLASKIPHSFGGVELTEVGEIQSGNEILLINSSGNQSLLEPAGWDPFRK